jgi:hypothetical protein
MHNYSIIQGGRYTDQRGTIISSNDLDMSQIRRQYIIEHNDPNIIRAWQGHRYESKWMRCLLGSFIINLIKPISIENPTGLELAEVIPLLASQNQILHIPGGYYIGIKSDTNYGMLQVYSDVRYIEANLDDLRQKIDFWSFNEVHL